MKLLKGERAVQVRGMGYWLLAKVIEDHGDTMLVEFSDGERKKVSKDDIIE